MQIANTTRGTVLGEGVRELEFGSETMLGLLTARTPAAIHLRTRWGVHTLGMRFPIDVLVCGPADGTTESMLGSPTSEGRRTSGGGDSWVVRAVRENMKPWRFFLWNPVWRNVLELPAGTIAATGTTLGDVLQVT